MSPLCWNWQLHFHITGSICPPHVFAVCLASEWDRLPVCSEILEPTFWHVSTVWLASIWNHVPICSENLELNLDVFYLTAIEWGASFFEVGELCQDDRGDYNWWWSQRVQIAMIWVCKQSLCLTFVLIGVLGLIGWFDFRGFCIDSLVKRFSGCRSNLQGV